MEDVLLSSYGRASTQPSPVNRMMAAFAEDFREGVDINLGVGYVSERTIPHKLIESALHEVVAKPQAHKAAFNYGGPAGAKNLVSALRAFIAGRAVGGLSESILEGKRIIVGASGATSLLEAASQVLATGLVITADPVYYIYGDLLQRAGFTLTAVPEDDEGIDTAKLQETIDDLGPKRESVSFVYVVTVSNPTCTILSDRRRVELLNIVSNLSRTLGRKVPLIMDAAYELLIHDPAVPRPQSALLHDDLGIVYELGTLSKILAPALRVGYMIGPDGPFLDALVQNVSDTGFSAPLANQEIAAILLNEHVAEQIERVNVGYRQKAAQMRGLIDEHLGPFIAEVRGGSAGFYYYLTFKQIDTREGSRFFKTLTRTTGNSAIEHEADVLRPRVIYVPGEYCVHRGGALEAVGRRQLRLSYGFESPAQIERGIRLMGEAAQRAEAAGSDDAGSSH
jgi:DNA-binding transcriptional MocR family regulator